MFIFSECAPIPVTRCALCNVGVLRTTRSEPAEEGHVGCGRRSAVPGVRAVATAYAFNLPITVVGEAFVAGPKLGRAWVEVGLFIERDDVGGVFVAEDVTTTSAVMSALEDGEVLWTVGILACKTFIVSLPVVSRRRAGDFTQFLLAVQISLARAHHDVSRATRAFHSHPAIHTAKAMLLRWGLARRFLCRS